MTIKTGAAAVARPFAQFTRETLSDRKTGRFSIGKALTWAAFYFLTEGFISEYTDRTVDWTDFIGYSVAVLILLMPHEAERIIRAIKGDAGAAPAPVAAPVNSVPVAGTGAGEGGL